MKKILFIIAISFLALSIPAKNNSSFFQDPVKTPKHPNQATHVGTVDGSAGKFKNPHVDHHKQSSFAHNSHHLKTAKHHKEHTTGKNYEKVGK